MNRGAEKRARADWAPPRERPVDKHVAELRGMHLWPSQWGHAPTSKGMRGVPRRPTKRPFGPYGKTRRARRPITVACLSCKFQAIATTWRPAKALLAAHAGKKHPGLAK